MVAEAEAAVPTTSSRKARRPAAGVATPHRAARQCCSSNMVGCWPGQRRGGRGGPGRPPSFRVCGEGRQRGKRRANGARHLTSLFFVRPAGGACVCVCTPHARASRPARPPNSHPPATQGRGPDQRAQAAAASRGSRSASHPHTGAGACPRAVPRTGPRARARVRGRPQDRESTATRACTRARHAAACQRAGWRGLSGAQLQILQGEELRRAGERERERERAGAVRRLGSAGRAEEKKRRARVRGKVFLSPSSTARPVSWQNWGRRRPARQGLGVGQAGCVCRVRERPPALFLSTSCAPVSLHVFFS